MLDANRLRNDISSIKERLKSVRNVDLDVDAFQSLDSQRKSLQVETESLQHERNRLSKDIGRLKASGEDASEVMATVKGLSDKLESNKKALHEVQAHLDDFLLHIPNLPHESVPVGQSEADNQVIRQWGEVPQFDFTPKSHDELGESLGLIDFKASAKITGSRFVVLRSQVARLHRALAQFMLDTHVSQHGYEEVYVPFIVNRESLLSTGQLPKFEEDLFKLQGEHDYYLTSTGEVPVANLVRQTMLDKETLPIKLVSHTPCFRSEAGSYGKDTKGMIRQHQFEKVELIWVSKPEDSYEALETLTNHAETILQQLKLPYQVAALCGGDLGFTAAKTYDLEVWLPSQDCYREISSCSNCEDFQARRMQARFKDESGKVFAHTLNGSGLAVGRTLVAVLENYQNAQGGIDIPQVLQSYMGGLTTISA